jgi:hypothetical protein
MLLFRSLVKELAVRAVFFPDDQLRRFERINFLQDGFRKDSESGYMYNIKDVVVFEKLDRILAICLDPEAYILVDKASS